MSRRMHEGKLEGQKKGCGHWCANKLLTQVCCRCHKPENNFEFLNYKDVCGICRGVMRKYVDGYYFQKCPDCEDVVKTLDPEGMPAPDPLETCGCKQRTRERVKPWRNRPPDRDPYRRRKPNRREKRRQY